MRLPANLGRLLPALCLGVLLSACSTFGQRDPLRIDLVGLEPLPGQGMEMRFMVKLRVQNPNDEPIEYNGIALDLDVNGQPLASGVSDQTGEVPRFGERVVSVPLTVSAFSAFRQAWGLSNNAPTRGMPYVVKGKLAGGLFGTKIVLNEFVAYINLGQVQDGLAPTSLAIITFALCGFANFSSIAIQMAVTGNLAPNQRPMIARLGLKALVAGSLANLMSAALAGLMLSLR